MTGPMMIRGPGQDLSVTRQQITPGTTKRVLPYAKSYRGSVVLLLLATTLNSGTAVATPVLFKFLIDDGIMRGAGAVVLGITLAVIGLTILSSILGLAEAWYSARISEGLVYQLRTRAFEHVQRQSLAFFTRAQTGALVSRLNTDVVSAQQSVSMLLSTVVSAALTLLFVLGAMFFLSWQIAVISLLCLPLFVLPGKLVGKRLQRITRAGMQTNGDLGALMSERFNVSGALLAKLYGRPRAENAAFAGLAGKARDLGVLTVVNGRVLFLTVALLSGVATALVYGVGGGLVIQGAFQIGTLVALATLLTRLFAPINMLSTAQATALTALVSFDRLFEILDLKPLIAEKPGAAALPDGGKGQDIVFDKVSFRYPAAAEVTVPSLAAFTTPVPERPGDLPTLRELTFTVPAGKLTALVGPSGAGKTTITHLVPRLYDPIEGSVRIGGQDLRDLDLESLHSAIGVVTQDAYLFHSTIRENLTYARPEATEQEVIEACRAAQIWDLVEALPDGLDTVVGDRGYRLSGGEKQRIAMARLLVKAPSIVVLDEATAHLDSESEAALQRALETALVGRTSVVIAHRLSTVRNADQILVIDKGEVRERGTHDELIARGGLYAELYRTQFAEKPSRNGDGPARRTPEPVGAGAPGGGGPMPGPMPGGPMPGPMPGGPMAGPFPGPPPGPPPMNG